MLVRRLDIGAATIIDDCVFVVPGSILCGFSFHSDIINLLLPTLVMLVAGVVHGSLMRHNIVRQIVPRRAAHAGNVCLSALASRGRD